MVKVCFLQSEWPNQQVLDTYKKMTPNCSGQWHEMVGVPSIEEADFCVIIDYTNQEVPANKAIYIGAHPTSCGGYVCFDDKEAVARLDLRDTPGFGEWWIDYSYDELINLPPPKKTKKAICIVSNQRTYDYHRRRIEFLNEYCQKFPGELEIYGRIQCRKNEEHIQKHYRGVLGTGNDDPNYLSSYWYGKESALELARYVLEFDMGASPEMGKCENYFSERFYDDILLWATPIYYGGTNLEKFFPPCSFYSLDIFTHTVDYVHSIINNNVSQEHYLEAIAECRDLLLNKYQLWPRIYRVINSL